MGRMFVVQKKISLLAVGVLVFVALGFASPVMAWHPKGSIVKKVQNQTTSSVLGDANTEATAVAAKFGDTLKYVIEVSNTGQPNSKGENDMHFTTLTDTLPAGVELISNPAQREVKLDLGVLKPGQKVAREFTVKVTSGDSGKLIENKACFTGDSKVKDQPQKGCDVATIKTDTPPAPAPKEQPKEQPKETPQPLTPKVLPSTGPEAVLASAFGIGAVSYGAHAYLRSRRTLRNR